MLNVAQNASGDNVNATSAPANKTHLPNEQACQCLCAIQSKVIMINTHAHSTEKQQQLAYVVMMAMNDVVESFWRRRFFYDCAVCGPKERLSNALHHNT